MAPPPAEKFFDRTSPVETLRGFVYATDAHQWEYAFESLSRETREEIGPLRFEVAVRFAELNLYEPASGEQKQLEVSLYELISNLLERVSRDEPNYRREGRGMTSMLVTTRARDDDGTLIYIDARIYFCEEDGDWRIDLLRSLRLAR